MLDSRSERDGVGPVCFRGRKTLVADFTWRGVVCGEKVGLCEALLARRALAKTVTVEATTVTSTSSNSRTSLQIITMLNIDCA